MKSVSNELALELYNRLQDHTMVGLSKFTDTLKLASAIGEIEGDIVECGVWRGGMLAGLMHVMGAGRKYYAYDSFEGLPPAEAIDGDKAINFQKETKRPAYYNNCAAEAKWVSDLFKDKPELLRVVPGWFKDTLLLEENLPKKIAILRLDGDWFESTLTALTFLYPRLALGGLVIIDDYEDWEGCKRGVHTYFNLIDASIEIIQMNSTFYFYKLKNL
jgi:hypothetical protein